MQSARASLDELRMLETGDEALKQALAFASQLHALAPVDPSTDLHAVDREAIAVALDAARSAPGHRAPRNVIDEIVGARTGVDGLRGAARALTELSELLTTPAELAAWSELQRKRIETLDALARAELELRTGSGKPNTAVPVASASTPAVSRNQAGSTHSSMPNSGSGVGNPPPDRTRSPGEAGDVPAPRISNAPLPSAGMEPTSMRGSPVQPPLALP
ncbi:MAG: hypothetical protein IT457_01630 [Planctomycetes bacterium]|nr:hypothetical protein [Planctomycetota bacterium]